MGGFNRRLFGYSIKQVDQRVAALNKQVEYYQGRIDVLEEDISQKDTLIEEMTIQLDAATEKVEVMEATQEEIARMALKEAATLINKAKHNANLILTESLLYVRSLSDEMDDFKHKTAKFRTAVVEMSKDLLDTIDNSEVFTILSEDKKD